MSTQLRRSSRIRKHTEKNNSLQAPKKKRRLNTKKKTKSSKKSTTASKKPLTRNNRKITTKKKNNKKNEEKEEKEKEKENTYKGKYISRSKKNEPSKKPKLPYEQQEPSINQKIADKFHELAELEKLNLNISRGAQARKTARIIESSTELIKNDKDAIKLHQIGKKSANAINEIIETGTLARIEELKHRKKYEKDEGPSCQCKNKKNEQLANIFEELSMYEFDDQDQNRGAMFRLMAKNLRNIKETITSGEQIKKFNGFGPSAKEIVDDYLKTGKVIRLENFKKEFGTPQQHLKILHNREKKWKKEGKI